MAASTGPIMATAAVVLFNDIIVAGRPPIQETRVVVGAGIVAAALALLEKPAPELAKGLSWFVLMGVLVVRINPNVPSPIESFAAWYKEGK